MAEPNGVIYCGTCGGLNPRTNHYCSACGHQLVDAYHASEGLRIYSTPDPGAPLVEIVDPGADLTVVDTDEDLPADFVKVMLEDGRIGYVRLREVEASVADRVEVVRRQPIGCISSNALLAVIALLVLSSTFVLLTAIRSGQAGADNLLAVIACLAFVPFFLFVVGFYLYVRKREDELLEERQADDEIVPLRADQTAEPLAD